MSDRITWLVLEMQILGSQTSPKESFSEVCLRALILNSYSLPQVSMCIVIIKHCSKQLEGGWEMGVKWFTNP